MYFDTVAKSAYTLIEMSSRMSIDSHHKRTFVPIQYENMPIESAHNIALCQFDRHIFILNRHKRTFMMTVNTHSA
jgi:hypothetical protein